MKKLDALPKRRIGRGRRVYGFVYTLPNGREVYLAHRKQGEIFRSGKLTISEAIHNGTAAWAMDDETLIERRSEGVKVVGVLVKDTDDVYLTTIDRYFDPSNAKILNYESRGGALQRYLPLQFFARRVGASLV